MGANSARLGPARRRFLIVLGMILIRDEQPCSRAAVLTAQQPTGADQGRAPLKVFVLVGQSNMVGHGLFEARNASTGRFLNGTLGWLAGSPRTRAEFGKLRLRGTAGGEPIWAHREDVLVINDVNSINDTGLVGSGSAGIGGFLRPGWGGDSSAIGPELGFGWTLGDALAPQTLLLKVAWGGKSLGADFRPPSSGGSVGSYYVRMVAKVRHYLANLESVLPPGSAAGGYELSGFVWHQGWNDGCNVTLGKEYRTNLANLIRDVRKEFRDLPQKQHLLPVVIGVSGMGCCTSGQCASQCRKEDCVDDPEDPTETTNSCETTLADYVIPAQLSVANATRYPVRLPLVLFFHLLTDRDSRETRNLRDLKAVVLSTGV